MSLFKRNTSYGRKQGPAELPSPYDRARREWDNRLGTARVQASHWRLVAVLSLMGMLGMAAGLVHVSAHKDVKTYVIEVDQLGQPARISLLDRACKPSTAAAGYFVRQLVTLVRQRPLDPVVVHDNWKTAYGFLAGDAIQTMNTYALADPLIRMVDGQPLTRTVAVSNVLQKSQRSYQVRWVETTSVGGKSQRPEQYTGLFEVELIPPRDEAEMFRNPLGIYVVSFTWSKEFTGPVTSDVEPVAPSTAINQESTHESNDQ